MAEPAVTQTLDLCLRLGELLISNGAGAADVTVTMDSVARQLGIRHAEIDVTFTSLSMSYQASQDAPPAVLMRQVKQREIDYDDLTAADHLVQRILTGEVDAAQARAAVVELSSGRHRRRRWTVTLGWGAMAAGVSLMLGGDARVMVTAVIAAVSIDRVQLAMWRRRLPGFYLQVAGGVVAMLFAVLAVLLGVADDPSLVVTANIVILLSGIGFMGALQDALTGFYLTSAARLLEALLATGGIIVGVSGGVAVANLLGIELGRLELGITDIRALAVLMVGAAVAAAGFAFASYAGKRVLVPVGLLGGGAIVLARVLEDVGLGRLWGVFSAAFLVGVVGFAVARRVRVPPLVVVVSAVVPMLPGLSIYRGLSLLGDGGSEAVAGGVLAMVTAASVALALASGVILGEYVAQPLSREARRLEKRLAGPRLVGPLRQRVGQGPATTKVHRPRRAG